MFLFVSRSLSSRALPHFGDVRAALTCCWRGPDDKTLLYYGYCFILFFFCFYLARIPGDGWMVFRIRVSGSDLNSPSLRGRLVLDGGGEISHGIVYGMVFGLRGWHICFVDF